MLAIAADDGVYLQVLTEVIVPVGRRRLNRTTYRVWSVAFTAALSGLVTGDQDGHVRLWDTWAGDASLVGTHEGPVWAVAASPDERYVAAGGTDIVPSATLKNVARIWDVDSGQATPLLGHRAAVTAIAYAPDGGRIATSCRDGLVRIFDAASGRLMRELGLADGGHARHPEAYAVTFSPDGTRLFAGYADGSGRLFKLSPSAPTAR